MTSFDPNYFLEPYLAAQVRASGIRGHTVLSISAS